MKIKYSLEDFDGNHIINKFGMQKGGKAELFLANTCFRRMSKYVPKDTGALMTTATIKPSLITYEQPYAHKQYVSNKGKDIRGKYWDRKMWNNEKQLVEKEVEDYIKATKGNR